VIDPPLEMRRLAGKVAFLLAGIYVLFLFAAVVTLFNGRTLPLWKYGSILCPAALFIPSVLAGVRLHRTADKEQTRPLWRRSLILAVLGMVIVISISLAA
jgi:hypothetical protein